MILQLKMNLRDKALISYQKVSEMNPANLEIWLDLSELYSDAEDLEMAIQTIQIGMEYQENNIMLVYRYAAYLYKSGKIKEALKKFESAIAVDFSKQNEFFDVMPELLGDPNIIAIIEIYKQNS